MVEVAVVDGTKEMFDGSVVVADRNRSSDRGRSEMKSKSQKRRRVLEWLVQAQVQVKHERGDDQSNKPKKNNLLATDFVCVCYARNAKHTHGMTFFSL